MDAAVRIEKGGKPAVVVAAPPFREEVISHSELHGIPYLSFVVVDYTQGDNTQLPDLVEKTFDKMVKALTTSADELQKKTPGEIV